MLQQQRLLPSHSLSLPPPLAPSCLNLSHTLFVSHLSSPLRHFGIMRDEWRDTSTETALSEREASRSSSAHAQRLWNRICVSCSSLSRVVLVVWLPYLSGKCWKGRGMEVRKGWCDLFLRLKGRQPGQPFVLASFAPLPAILTLSFERGR